MQTIIDISCNVTTTIFPTAVFPLQEPPPNDRHNDSPLHLQSDGCLQPVLAICTDSPLICEPASAGCEDNDEDQYQGFAEGQ